MSKSSPFRQGIVVGIVLFILTVIEYVVALQTGSATILLLLGAAKGVLVVYYFMHITSLWREDEGH